MAKILYLRLDVSKSHYGGSFTHQKELIAAFRKLGCMVKVLSGVHGEGFIQCGYVPFLSDLLLNARVVFRFEDCDFIYQRHGRFACAGVFLSWYYNVPLILECNGSEVWIKKRWGRGRLLLPVLRFFEWLQIRYADKVIVPSKAIKEQMGTGIVIPNGVNTETFKPQKRKHYRGQFTVGWAGVPSKWHGIEDLMNLEFHTVIIGAEGSKRGIDFLGFVPHEQIPEYLASCDVLICPTKSNNDGSEFIGSPTKLFEFMAMGKPVLARPEGQVKEIITHWRNGILYVEQSDLDVYLRILEREPQLRKRLGRAARRTALKYTWDKTAERILDEYGL